MRVLFIAVMLGAALASVHADVLMGNGKIDSELRSVRSFRSISVGGSGLLRVHRGGQRVEVTCDSNILPYITTEVSGDELKIGLKPFTSILKATKMEFDITLPELRGVRIAGSGDAYVDAFKGDEFKADVSGSGGIKMDLEYKSVELNCSGSGGFDAAVKAGRLDLRCAGSGDAYIYGSADRAEVAISGSGTLGAKGFAAGEARVIINGSGHAEIRVATSLDVHLSGSGSVKYWGDPSVKQRVSGSGRVSKADD